MSHLLILLCVTSFASLTSLNGPSSSNVKLSAVSSNATVTAVCVTRLMIPEAMSLDLLTAFNQPSPTMSPTQNNNVDQYKMENRDCVLLLWRLR